ncbi:cyclic nucleotide-binding domain-containing protein [Sphingobacterium sp. DK4209]|uniref:Cyclic nucleotide-binding domain-containing protein n=1 Tax=Sphingobacterium zhuxiongii TaxID=2662364 RepID=A0A5Q0Q7G1_9SPHI|nr:MULTISPECIES: Crp/Fnr family transcriptional regulator [unclassified Sphingobacterium]MVZ64957.1 cyclic nucleotide-binding domain-containing protein [Sphingobacterium sp. DK4209]QGA25296.1 cyclic nucleotide-binding domain-containing protein [Sphingobacterium sp. dk4302]
MDFKASLFQMFDLSDKQADLILSKFRRERLEKNELYLEEGKKCEKMSFIQAGYCRVFRQTPDKEVTQWIGGQGYFVTDLASFLFDQEAKWSIDALTSVELFTLNKKDYQTIEGEIPDWNILEKRFIAKCFMVLEQRIFNFIALSAEERYRQYFEQQKDLFNQVPLQYIASVLGMSPETLSRIRSKG